MALTFRVHLSMTPRFAETAWRGGKDQPLLPYPPPPTSAPNSMTWAATSLTADGHRRTPKFTSTVWPKAQTDHILRVHESAYYHQVDTLPGFDTTRHDFDVSSTIREMAWPRAKAKRPISRMITPAPPLNTTSTRNLKNQSSSIAGFALSKTAKPRRPRLQRYPTQFELRPPKATGRPGERGRSNR